MDFQKAFIDFSTYILHCATLYLIFDALANRLYLRSFFKAKAEINLAVNQSVTQQMLDLSERQINGFHLQFPDAGQFDPYDQTREVAILKTGRAISYAAGRFAVFQAPYPASFPLVTSAKTELHYLLEGVKSIYLDVRGMNAEEAEKKIIEDTMFAIADLDFGNEIIPGTILSNPAQDYFEDSKIRGTERTQA